MRCLDVFKLVSRCLRTLLKNLRATTTRKGFMRMLACYEEILRQKKRYLYRQITMLDFFKSSSGTLYYWDIGDDNPDDPPAAQKEVPPP
jgi:hypothetical protein